MTTTSPCLKCGTVVTFKKELFKPCPNCGGRVHTMNTYCFFCGKITTDLHGSHECDNPECQEKYKLAKEGELPVLCVR